MLPRYASVAGLSLLITFSLFFAMQALIAMDELELPPPTEPWSIGFERVIEDTEVQETIRAPERPTPPETPPALIDFSVPSVGPGNLIAVLGPVEPEPTSADTLAFRRDSDAVPIVRVEPTYPARMAARGIEGWVELEFSIGKMGNVMSPRVTSSSNPGFDRAALRAVRGWKYNPKIEDGEAVARDGIRVRLSFSLNQAST